MMPMLRPLHTVVSAVTMATLLSAHPVAAQEVAERISRLVETSLAPEVGTPELVTSLLRPPTVGPALPDAFDLERLRGFLKDSALAPDPEGRARPPLALQDPSRQLLRGTGGSALFWDPGRGRIDYLNPARRFDPAAGRENRVTRDRARSQALELAAALGIPGREISEDRIRVRELTVASGDVKGREPVEVWRAEVHVRLPRRVNGTIVYRSRLHTVVDARSRVARFHADWPTFRLCAGLEAGTAIARQAMVDSVARRLNVSHHDPRTLDKVVTLPVYAQPAQFEAENPMGADEADRETVTQRTPEATCFVPALVVVAEPIEPREDSGEISFPIEEIVFPLLERSESSDPATG